MDHLKLDAAVEIRKLAPNSSAELAIILEYAESWKRLMAIIPKMLEKDQYKADVTVANQHKYRSEHFTIIEDASRRTRSLCSAILLDEWGTSGRVRPALGHLLYLLVKANLFRAADFVAIKLLGGEPPERPATGPAAKVIFEPLEVRPASPRRDPQMEEVERILDQIDYPSSAIRDIQHSSVHTNMNYTTPKPIVVPKIVISEISDDDVRGLDFKVPLVRKQNPPKQSEVSDMIVFSANSTSESKMSNDTVQNANFPRFSAVMSDDVNPSVQPIIPNLSMLDQSDSEIKNLPDLSALNIQEFTSNSNVDNSMIPSSLTQSSTDDESDSSALDLQSNTSNSNVVEPPVIPSGASYENPVVPNLSMFNNSATESNNIPVLSILNQNSSKSALVLNSTGGGSTNLQLPGSGDDASKPVPSRQCTSPLPNLSLNTLLPHYTYVELEVATNNFDETPLNKEGRFLGQGAFGKVFLALGLMNKYVAVKKLNLDNDDAVGVDDTITKQFRNEVEVLSKYKHENLLSLLGYSCDGCTYCLLYDYVPGGALKDRLQRKDNKLIWTERLYIAIGIAKAISYLHTAFETPLIHRDVKTANILLDLTNKPKLCDFGIITLSPNQNTSVATAVYGTSVYMAPEAFRGTTTIKLDTFSFGVVLLELLTSLPPWDETRQSPDLVTRIEEHCDGTIHPLLDTSAGPWKANGIDLAEELFRISGECLSEWRKRPNMVEVTAQLARLIQNCIVDN